MRGMTRRRSAVLCLLLCAPLAACGGDSGGGDAPKRGTIDSARKTGRDARAAVDGRVRDPAEILLRVSAAPKQRVTVSWGMSCPKTASGKAKGTGHVYVTTPPDTRALTLPKRAIAFCAVTAQARLSGKGRVKLALIGRERG
jgi:hypothetical protein